MRGQRACHRPTVPARHGGGDAVPWESRADVQPVHVLADQELQDADSLQLQQCHVGLGGPGILKGGVELGGQPLFLHGPDAIGPPVEEKKKGERSWKQQGVDSSLRMPSQSALRGSAAK